MPVSPSVRMSVWQVLEKNAIFSFAIKDRGQIFLQIPILIYKYFVRQSIKSFATYGCCDPCFFVFLIFVIFLKIKRDLSLILNQWVFCHPKLIGWTWSDFFNRSLCGDSEPLSKPAHMWPWQWHHWILKNQLTKNFPKRSFLYSYRTCVINKVI